MINFKTIRWKNFLSTGNQFSEITLNTNRNTVLTGDSGSGKSTVLDAISFGLFNKPFRGINKNQLVNSINNKDCLVEIEFSIGTNNYLVRRGIKPNLFEIIKNDVLVDQDAAVRDYQDMLEKTILKCNFKSFSQIVVLGAVNFVPFMQLKPQDRRVIIEELLDLEIFSIMNTLLKKKMSALADKLKTKEAELNIVAEKIKIHNDLIQSLEAEQQTDTAAKKAKIESLKENIEKITKEIDDLQIEIDKKVPLVNIKSQVQQDITKLSEAIAKLSLAKKQIEKELKFYESHDNCPTCMQDIEDNFKDEMISVKKSKVSDLDDNTQKIETKLSERKSQRDKIADIQTELQELERKKYSLEVDITNSKLKIKELSEELENIGNNENERIQALKDSIEGFESETKAIEASAKKTERDISIRETAQLLLKDSGIKSKIIKQYLPIINQHVGMFLNSMNFFVGFELNEYFEETVHTAGKDIFTYGNFSEGEKQRLDLSLLFTWRAIAKMKNSIHTNLLIMDEIFDSYLDHEATENVIELLKSDLFKDTNIFVISHKSAIVDKFERNLKFEKVKGFSQITS